VRRPLAAALLATAALLPLAAGIASAHPLGNFTINHYAGIRVEPDRILLDVVIDEAEIPAFQAAQALDADGSGALSAAELDAARVASCLRIGADLSLSVDGVPTALQLTAAGLSMPPGSGGLPTMRIVCQLTAPQRVPITSATTIVFTDAFEASRIGWREMSATGDRVTLSGDAAAGSLTGRLTSYPSGLASAPDVRTVNLRAVPGGTQQAPFTAPDATPVDAVAVPSDVAVVPSAGAVAPPVTGGSPVAAGPSVAAVPPAGAAVPGGDVSIPPVLGQAPVTPWLALAALLAAVLLGAGHAVTPGHGKTLMAAYLVGTRGTPRHAVVLGLVVAVSHTLGILGLAAIVLGAETTLPPDVVVRAAPLIAALGIVAVGAWMLALEVRRWHRSRRAAALAGRNLDHHHDRPGQHGHDHGHDHSDAHDHGDGHDHSHASGHEEEQGHEHGRGPFRHSHAPASGTRVTRRGLVVLGLAGGLVPSANALLILLATVAAGRPAWGVVLVVAFGLGMAGVLSGVGLAFVYARGFLERAAGWRPARLGALLPATTAIAVLVFGLVLTSSALSAASIR